MLFLIEVFSPLLSCAVCSSLLVAIATRANTPQREPSHTFTEMQHVELPHVSKEDSDHISGRDKPDDDKIDIFQDEVCY